MLKSSEVSAWIIDYLAGFLDMEAGQIDLDGHLGEYGLDSSDAVIMAGALEERFAVEVEPALFLRNTTINQLLEDLRVQRLVE